MVFADSIVLVFKKVSMQSALFYFIKVKNIRLFNPMRNLGLTFHKGPFNDIVGLLFVGKTQAAQNHQRQNEKRRRQPNKTRVGAQGAWKVHDNKTQPLIAKAGIVAVQVMMTAHRQVIEVIYQVLAVTAFFDQRKLVAQATV